MSSVTSLDAAVDVEVGRLRHHDRASEHPGCMVAVRLERILSGHLAGVEPNPAVLAPRTHGTPEESSAGDEADALVCTQARHETGPAFLEILQSEPDRGVHVQQAEVSRAQHRDAGAGAASAPWSTCRLLAAAARRAARPVIPPPARSSARESTRPQSSTGASREATFSSMSRVQTSPRSVPNRSRNVWPWDWPWSESTTMW